MKEIVLSEKMIGKFWKSSGKDASHKCWNWTGRRNVKNYGMICHDGKDTRAHRVSYVIHNGPIPDGLFVCHRCDNPSCVNPTHLFLGNALANNRDSIQKGRSNHSGLVKLTSERAKEIAGYCISRAATGAQHNAGEKHWHVKLTEAQAEEIIRELHLGKSPVALSGKYPVSRQQIFKISRRMRWKHLWNKLYPLQHTSLGNHRKQTHGSPES